MPYVLGILFARATSHAKVCVSSLGVHGPEVSGQSPHSFCVSQDLSSLDGDLLPLDELAFAVRISVLRAFCFSVLTSTRP